MLVYHQVFVDYRHVDVHFAFHLVNCSEYARMALCIPCENRFHQKEIVSTSLLVNHRMKKSEWTTNGDPFVSSCSIIFLCIFYFEIR